MKKIKIAIGTTSENKIKFIQEVLNELEILKDTEISPVKSPSNVSEQPLTEKETNEGSFNRAKYALENSNEADFGLGIEVGYHKNNDGKYEMFCCATIIDQEELDFSCISHKLLLAKFHHEKLESKCELCDFVEEYYKNTKNPVKKYLGKAIDSRELIIKDAVRQALLKYLLKEEY